MVSLLQPPTRKQSRAITHSYSQSPHGTLEPVHQVKPYCRRRNNCSQMSLLIPSMPKSTQRLHGISHGATTTIAVVQHSTAWFNIAPYTLYIISQTIIPANQPSAAIIRYAQQITWQKLVNQMPMTSKLAPKIPRQQLNLLTYRKLSVLNLKPG